MSQFYNVAISIYFLHYINSWTFLLIIIIVNFLATSWAYCNTLWLLWRYLTTGWITFFIGRYFHRNYHFPMQFCYFYVIFLQFVCRDECNSTKRNIVICLLTHYLTYQHFKHSYFYCWMYSVLDCIISIVIFLIKNNLSRHTNLFSRNISTWL